MMKFNHISTSRLILWLIGIIALFTIVVSSGCGFYGKMVRSQTAQINALQYALQAHNDSIKNQGVAEYIKSNPCPAPAILDLDSLCAIYYQCPPVNLVPEIASVDSIKPKVVNCKPIIQLIPDERLANLYKDSLAAERLKNATLTGQIAGITTTAANQIALQTQHGDAWERRFWILLLSAAAIIGLQLYFKI